MRPSVPFFWVDVLDGASHSLIAPEVHNGNYTLQTWRTRLPFKSIIILTLCVHSVKYFYLTIVILSSYCVYFVVHLFSQAPRLSLMLSKPDNCSPGRCACSVCFPLAVVLDIMQAQLARWCLAWCPAARAMSPGQNPGQQEHKNNTM